MFFYGLHISFLLFCLIYSFFNLKKNLKTKKLKIIWITSVDNVIRQGQEKELQCNEVICQGNSALLQDENC